MLLSNISKIIEKLVHMRLSKFLNKNAIIYEKQFGFRNNRSTTHTLLGITEKRNKKTRNKKITKQLNFCVSGQKIKQSSHVRYLGVILQDDLCWDAQLTNLEKKP